MQNIEIKAKCSCLKSAREKADKLKTKYVGHLHQVDTYFNTKTGRLKLREIDGKEAQLIPYYKEYQTGPMKSNYSVLKTEEPQKVKEILTEILGEVIVVDKKREVFLIDNIRVHLDEVKNLGTFIEFEAVYEEASVSDRDREVKKVADLLESFEINQNDLLDKSYIDYLLEETSLK